MNRAARPEWDNSYWDYWSKIDTVWLGGGLASGKLGQALAKHAHDVFALTDNHRFQIHVSPYGPALSLVGVSRYAPTGSKRALVFDFGSTFIKRTVANFYPDYTFAQYNSLNDSVQAFFYSAVRGNMEN